MPIKAVKIMLYLLMLKYVICFDAVIETKCQFHQHFIRTFWANILAPKITKLKLLALRLFGQRISVKNARVKC